MPKSGEHKVNYIDSFFRQRPSINSVREGETISFLEDGKLIKQEKRNGVVYQSEFAEAIPKLSTDEVETGVIREIIAGDGLTGGGFAGEITLNVVGGTGITANANDIAIDSTVATLTGTQTLSNKTLTAPTLTGTTTATRINLGSTDTSSFLTGDPKIAFNGYMMLSAIVNETETGGSPAAIVFGNNSTYGNDEISLITAGQNRLFINSSGDITISQDLTISGDLQVNGTTTTVNQTNLDVSDNIIGLNRGLTGASANDSGLIIERGTTGDNIFIGYDESLGTSGRVRFATTTALPNATGALSFSGDANVHAGRFYGDVTGNVTGNLTGNVTGNVTGSASLNLLTSNNLSDLANASTARSNLGLGTGAELDTAAVSDGATTLATGNAIYDHVTSRISGFVDTSGTPVDNDFAKFTDANTIEGRSASETRTDLGLVIGTDVQAYDEELNDIASINTSTLTGSDNDKFIAWSFSSAGFVLSSFPATQMSGSTNNGLLTYNSQSVAAVESNLTFDASDKTLLLDGTGASAELATFKWYQNEVLVAGSDQTGNTGTDNGVNITLNATHGTTLNTLYRYKITLTTTGTGTDSGAVYIVSYDEPTTTWIARMVSRAGSSSNHPLLHISGSNAQAYHNHNLNYDIAYSVESKYVGESDGTFHNFGADYHWQRDVDTLSYSDGDVNIDSGTFFVDASTDRVGIGVNNPSRKLQVAGAIELSASDDTLDTNHFALRRDSSGGGNLDVPGNMTINLDANNNETTAQFEICHDGSSTPVFKVQENGYTTAKRYYLEDTGAVIYRNSNDLELITYSGYDINLMPSGNVGIGTTSPGAKLDVDVAGSNGGMRVISSSDSKIAHFRLAGGSRELLQIGGESDSVSKVQIGTSATSAPAITIDSSDNVGIGTTSPGEKLDVNGTGYIRTAVFSDAFKPYSGTLATYGSSSSTDHYFVGDVGIGTNSPDAKLEVTGSTNSDLFSLEGAGSSFKLIGESGDATSINSMAYRLGLRYGSNDNGYIDFYRGPDGATGFLSFGTSGTERMRINSSGLIKVGPNGGDTTNVFEIDTSGSTQHGLMINADQARAAGRYALYVDDEDPNSRGSVVIQTASGPSLTTTGSVGIGTTTPASKLHIVESGLANHIRLSNTESDATTKYGAYLGSHYTNSEEPVTGMLITSGSASATGNLVTIGGGVSSANAANIVRFYTAANKTTLTGTERMRIDNSGNVGIGTTSPGAKLHIAEGFAYIYQTDDVGKLELRDSRASYDAEISQRSDGRISLATRAGTYGSNGSIEILDSGNVGIGTTSPSYKLHVIGTGQFSDDVRIGDDLVFNANANYIYQKDSAGTLTRMFGINASDNTYIGPIDSYAGGSILYGTSSNVADHNFYTGGTQRLKIDSNGVVQIPNDSGKFTSGAGSDLQLYHDGSNSNIRHFNSGNLNISSETSNGDVVLKTKTGSVVTTVMTIGRDNEIYIGETTQNQNLAFGGTLKTHQYLDTRDYMQHKGHFAESDWIVMESGANHVVTSYFDNTNVYVDGVYKGKIDSAFGQATISSADLSLGSVISADRAVIVHQSGTIRSMCMNTRFSGKLLGSGSTRGYPLTIHIYAPYSSVSYSIYRSSSANVDITATALTTGTISQGGIITFTESDTASGTQYYVIEADGKVCATLDDDVNDHLLFTPLAMEVIASSFSREIRGGVTTGIAEDSTNISETQNGTHAFYLKDTSGKYGLFACGVADGAGSEAEFAMPIEFCSDYYIYGSTDLSNYRLVCFQDTFVKVLDVSGNVLYTHDASSATKNAPLYFDNGTSTGAGTLSTAGPFRFVGTAPFYLVCQEPGGQDEATMLGAMQHELSNNQRFKGGYVPNATTIDANLVVNDTNFTLFADSANNRVGIGEANPLASLHLGASTGERMYVYANATVRAGFGVDLSGSSRELSIFHSSSNASDGNISFGHRLESNGSYAERMRITGAGNVGIGTNSPGALMHIDEDDNVGAFLVKGGGGGNYLGRFQRDVGGTAYVDIHCSSDDPQITFTDSGASRQYSIGADSSFNGFKIAENSSIGTNDRFGINDAGQVLVGTSISNRSSVAGYAPIFQTEAAGAAGYVQIVDSENGQFHGGSLALHKYRSGGIVANTELGSIWFGGTDSANSTFAQGALIRAYAEGADSGSNVATNVRFFTNTGSAVTEAMRIESDQDVHFDQDVIAFSTTPSDKRLKTNINDINYGLDAVMKLSPKEYDWKKDNRHDIGFIAQEVEEVIPEIVKDKKHFDKQIKTLDYEKLTAVLIKAVQEQQEQINELKEKLNG